MLYFFYPYCKARHIIAIMSKRSIEETYNEDSNSEFKYDDSENQLRKKIKLEIDMILDKVVEMHKEIDISEHEVHKFLLIFHTLAERINSDQPQEETDGFVTDTVLQIVNVIAGLLKNNMDSLHIPAVLRNALKKLKSLFIPQTKDSEEGKTGVTEPESAENTNETQEASEASEVSRDGSKEQWSSKNKK